MIVGVNEARLQKDILGTVNLLRSTGLRRNDGFGLGLKGQMPQRINISEGQNGCQFRPLEFY